MGDGFEGTLEDSMKLKYAVWFFLFFFTANTVLAQETLVLNTAAGAPYHTSEETGFVDRILREALGRIGIGVKIVKLPAERAIINANAGIGDGDAYRVAGLEKSYPNLVRVPENIATMTFVAFSKEMDFQTTGWMSLKPYSVGLITGWKIFEHNVTEAAQITKVKNKTQLFNLLVNGRAHVVLYEAWQGQAHLRKNKITVIKMLQPPFAEKDMFLYLHKKHRSLVPKVTAALRAMKADGTFQRLVDKLLTPLAAY